MQDLLTDINKTLHRIGFWSVVQVIAGIALGLIVALMLLAVVTP